MNRPTGSIHVLEMEGVGLIRDGKVLLDDISWVIGSDERWIVMGPNGSGKTSLIRIASMYEHPSTGSITLLGETLGRTDVRALRQRVALVSPAVRDLIRPSLSAGDVVMSAKYAALEPWWHTYSTADVDRATNLLASQGVGFAGNRPFSMLSSGEKQRVLLARALMGEPELVLLDEPCIGLDLAGREAVVDRLAALARDESSAPSVLVTHHIEEIPPGYTHLLALNRGAVVAVGPIAETLSAEVLSETFSMELRVSAHDDGRFSARRA